MLNFVPSVFQFEINVLFAVLILTPVIIMLGMCVVYFLFDAIQRRRRGHWM
ncbi:MAG: hypothetical protein ACOX7N_09515 [Lawsonibacter sp.]|jgi:hypothetical protein